MSFFSKFFSFFGSKVSNANKPDIKTVTFDSEGNVVNFPTDNPSDGTPEEVKKLAKNLYDRVNSLRK